MVLQSPFLGFVVEMVFVSALGLAFEYPLSLGVSVFLSALISGYIFAGKIWEARREAITKITVLWAFLMMPPIPSWVRLHENAALNGVVKSHFHICLFSSVGVRTSEKSKLCFLEMVSIWDEATFNYGVVVLQLKKPKMSFLICLIGKVICTGAKSERDAQQSDEYLIKRLKKAEFNVEKKTSAKI